MKSKNTAHSRNAYMKPSSTARALLLLCAGILTFSLTFQANGQNAKPNKKNRPNQQTQNSIPEQPLKDKWIKSLTNARQKLQNANGGETSKLVDEVLASLYRSEELSESDSASYVNRIRSHIDDLIRQGDVENAFTLTRALGSAAGDKSYSDGPSHPARAGGTPGPGGLVLYFPFDQQAANGAVKDESGTGNDGQVNGAQWVPDGRIGGAYRFKITNLTDRIVIPDNDSLDVANITMAAWIKTEDTGGFWNRIFDKDWRKGYVLTIGGGPNQEMRGNFSSQVNGSATVSRDVVVDGTWHHITATFDGKCDRLYVDGVEDKQTKKLLQSPPPGPIIPNNWDLCIGNTAVDYYGVREFCAYDGLIDEVRIYNRALSADEIQALFKSQGGVRVNYIADQYLANEIESKQLQLAGKIVKVKFNRIEYVRKSGDGVYTGILLSFVKPKGSTYYSGPGVVVKFPQEGLGFFKNIMTPVGVDDFISEMTKPDREEVYIQVGSDARSGSVAVGDQYKKDGDEREYRWSEKTEIPDLANQQKVSVRDAVLFPEQLNGKTVILEFYTVTQIKPKSDAEYNAYISSGRGDASVQITFPAAGLAFFKEIDAQESRAKVYSVYAKVNVSLKGIVTFEAKGRRVSGSGDEIEYRW